MARQTLQTAASVVCYINGKPYGLVTTFQWSSQTARKAIYGLDSTTPYELAPTVSKVTGSLGLIRQVGDSGIEGAGIAAPVPLLPREKYFTIALIDRTTDTIIFRADYCSVTNQTWTASARALVSGSISFEALDWANTPRQ